MANHFQMKSQKFPPWLPEKMIWSQSEVMKYINLRQPQREERAVTKDELDIRWKANKNYQKHNISLKEYLHKGIKVHIHVKEQNNRYWGKLFVKKPTLRSLRVIGVSNNTFMIQHLKFSQKTLHLLWESTISVVIKVRNKSMPTPKQSFWEGSNFSLLDHPKPHINYVNCLLIFKKVIWREVTNFPPVSQ